jgi:diguanylate cyclase (GGDEF)-like protein
MISSFCSVFSREVELRRALSEPYLWLFRGPARVSCSFCCPWVALWGGWQARENGLFCDGESGGSNPSNMMSKLTTDARRTKSLKPALSETSAVRVGTPERPIAPKLARTVADPDIAKLKAQVRRLTARLAEAGGRIKELEDRADTDGLFNILNRRGFERELNRVLAHIKRYHATAALIVLDVDYLKPVNDTFGHAAGDVVLKGIVDVILKHVRLSDLVGRLGGDEFAILLWNLSETAAHEKAAALEDAIDGLSFVFRGQTISSGASTGLVMLSAAVTSSAALEAADAAMYVRKKQRRERSRMQS